MTGFQFMGLALILIVLFLIFYGMFKDIGWKGMVSAFFWAFTYLAAIALLVLGGKLIDGWKPW